MLVGGGSWSKVAGSGKNGSGCMCSREGVGGAPRGGRRGRVTGPQLQYIVLLTHYHTNKCVTLWV
jgi:hypothetical protein